MSTLYSIRPVLPSDQPQLETLIKDLWGDFVVVVHNTVYYPANLPGFIAEIDHSPVGIITYKIFESQCEIITLNSLKEKIGIGTALIQAVCNIASLNHCSKVWLMTTNDNLNAIRFYQKHGFRLSAIHPGAVLEARKLKPSIPLMGEDGIPILDEIEMEYLI